ncbi:uncharacterized protein EAE97_011022 [Botrytis byssoidea]|uniref:Uncharacterized protein n=1 Tax=Botrytis byssoidea TaxID=139641 RepID=A0A9P5HU86_9HELO|nr:uncharacterized protein EAE97_011022 [Botrytis byssoidea]KAF7922858.1 hypothetical protein EAE97_011022 [Botrytis byssoidea]
MTTYSLALADVEARKKAAGFATEISKNLVYLRQQCQNNGDAIIKRWKKKSRNKREGLLRDIDSNLYPHRWPLVHLNEAFQATVPPDDWISADITLTLDYNSNSIILAGSAYRTLTQWKIEEAHRWTSVGFPSAILILEAQAHLLSFLRSMVGRILGSTIGSSMESQISSFNEISKCGPMTLIGRFDHIPGAASCYLGPSFSAPPILHQFSVEYRQDKRSSPG